MFWPPTYNPLAMLPRGGEEGAHAGAAGVEPLFMSGPASSGYQHAAVPRFQAALSPRLSAVAAPERGGGAAEAAHYAERQPTPELGAPAGSSGAEAAATKRRLEFLREEGARASLNGLQQRLREDVSACYQVRAVGGPALRPHVLADLRTNAHTQPRRVPRGSAARARSGLAPLRRRSRGI